MVNRRGSGTLRITSANRAATGSSGTFPPPDKHATRQPSHYRQHYCLQLRGEAGTSRRHFCRDTDALSNYRFSRANVLSRCAMRSRHSDRVLYMALLESAALVELPICAFFRPVLITGQFRLRFLG